MSTRTFRGVRLVRFGAFELDLRAAELRKYGVRIRLQEQPFRILVMLLERPGEVVLREELRKRLWPNDTVVEVGHGINAAILRLRDALGESAENPRYIETLARRGYRFNGEVEVVYKEAEAVSPAPSPQLPGLDTDDLQGKIVSHFSVLEKLGGGGMGVVYRAQDLNLGRQVALKFLPRELAGDALALSRFQREARAASALNHPNVCTVYGVEECAGQPVIVMEMIEGETLAARLARGPLPVGQALSLAIQVAGALDAAHRQSIVHRDLKPGNLLVTKSGVKVLDFGLAKIGRSPMAGSTLTRHGDVVGTPYYMSPEQMQGRETDARSDIFALGLVLYEMLTGRRALEGDSSPAVMAEPVGPPALRRLVCRCLARDPEERWQSVRDLKEALEWIVVGPAPVEAPVPLRRNWIYGVAAAALLMVVAYGAVKGFGDRPIQSAANATATHRLLMPAGMTLPPRKVPSPVGMDLNHFALSPDGHRLAYLSGGKLMVRELPTGGTREIEGGEATGTPFWSPDGKSLAFTAAGKLKRAVEGGLPVTICSVNTNLAGAWGTDGTILIGMIGDGIYRVPATGGVPERVTEPSVEQGETRHLLPIFLPGGRKFLYVAGSSNGGKSQLYAATLGVPGRAAIMPVSSTVGYSNGYLLYVKDRVLMAQRFDPARLSVAGQPKVLASGIMAATAAGAAVDIAEFSVGGDALAYRTRTEGFTLLQNWK